MWVHESYVKSVDGRYWFFGNNGHKECLRMGNISKVEEPMCIDDDVMKKLNHKQIKSVYLGNKCT